MASSHGQRRFPPRASPAGGAWLRAGGIRHCSEMSAIREASILWVPSLVRSADSEDLALYYADISARLFFLGL